MRSLVLATRNRDKIKEIRKLLEGLDFDLRTVDEFDDAPDVVEDGNTLEENALKKAAEIARHTQLPAVADDTGLEVDYLNGAPGVFSSRYSGEHATYADNVRKLLQDLEGVPREKRTARFRCVVAVVNGRRSTCVEGVCAGLITEAPRGDLGFGYDPIFFVPELNQTFAEMGLPQKNRMSHRAKAFLELRRLIEGDKIDFLAEAA